MAMVVSDVTTMEREFLFALRPSAPNYDKARRLLDDLRSAGASEATITWLTASLVYHENPKRKDDALVMTMTVVESPIENALAWAKACTQASKLAAMCADIEAMRKIRRVVETLRAMCAGDADVMSWTAGALMNVGRHLYNQRLYRESVAASRIIIETGVTDIAYECWIARAHANIAMCHARLGEVEQAKAHATVAEHDAIPSDSHVISHMLGEIALVDGDIAGARRLFEQAFDDAASKGDKFVMADVQVCLCHVFQALHNEDALWTAVRFARSLAVLEGSVHILDELAEIERTENSRKGGS